MAGKCNYVHLWREDFPGKMCAINILAEMNTSTGDRFVWFNTSAILTFF